MPCIMPEMPYCPACEFGRVTYPDGVDSYVDVLGGECNWECDCTEEAYERYHMRYTSKLVDASTHCGAKMDEEEK